jgi:hypothetical protein
VAGKAQLGILAAVGIASLAACRKASAPVPEVTLTPGMAAALATIEARTYPRPVHRGGALPGRFVDVVKSEWAGALAIHHGVRDEVCASGAKAGDAKCVAYLDATRAPLDRLLAATLVEEGGLGTFGGVLAPMTSGPMLTPPDAAATVVGTGSVPPANDVPRVALDVCERAALAIDASAASGDAVGALRTCGDAMAWARDVALGGSMIDAIMTRTCIAGFAAPACTRALAHAASDDRHELARALGVVRGAMPRIGVIERDDMTMSWLASCGALLDAPSLARLSPTAHAAAVAIPMPADLGDPAQAVQRCRDLEASLEVFWRPPASEVATASATEKYQAAWDAGLDALDRLIAAARP